MTTPSIIAPGKSIFSCKNKQESLVFDKLTYSIAAGTAATTIIGLIPFQKGMHLIPGTLFFKWADLANAGSAVVHVGWAYITGSSATDDPNGFQDSNNVTSAGINAVLAATGNGFCALQNGAEDDGWITIQIAGAAADLGGNVTIGAAFCYGNPPTNQIPS